MIIVIRVLNTQFSKLKLSKIFTSINVITKADIVSKNNLIFFGSLLSLNKSSKSNSFLTSLFNIKIIKDVNIQNNTIWSDGQYLNLGTLDNIVYNNRWKKCVSIDLNSDLTFRVVPEINAGDLTFTASGTITF